MWLTAQAESHIKLNIIIFDIWKAIVLQHFCFYLSYSQQLYKLILLFTVKSKNAFCLHKGPNKVACISDGYKSH